MIRPAAALRWGVGLALVGAAWGVMQLTPDDDVMREPFRTWASVGERVETRTLAGAVTDARLGERISDESGWRDTGMWLVLDLEIAAMETDADRSLEHVRLTLDDGTVYTASERPEDSLYRAPTHVGLPRTGSVAFELPPEAADERARIDIGTDLEPWVDALISLDLDLGSLEVRPSVELLPLGWSG
ncbi:hypothetical protein M1D46_16780 [Microbacterium sp. JZ70]